MINTYTTNDRDTCEPQWARELFCLGLNLLRQLTSWRENESIGAKMPIVVRERWKLGDECQHRNDEGCRLTRT